MKFMKYLDVHANDRLDLENEGSFLLSWHKRYGHNGNNLYFYFYEKEGTNYATDEVIPGLVSDGTITIRQADKIICDYFKLTSKLS